MKQFEKKKRIGLKNEKLILEAIANVKEEIEGYKVASYSKLARELGKNQVVVRDAAKRLEKKGVLEIKESFALFGTLKKKGFKIKNTLYLNEKGGKFKRK